MAFKTKVKKQFLSFSSNRKMYESLMVMPLLAFLLPLQNELILSLYLPHIHLFVQKKNTNTHKCKIVKRRANEWHNLQSYMHIKCGFVHFSIHIQNRLKRKQILLAYFIYVIPCAHSYCVVNFFFRWKEKQSAISLNVYVRIHNSHIICLFIIWSVCCGTKCLWLARMQLI